MNAHSCNDRPVKIRLSYRERVAGVFLLLAGALVAAFVAGAAIQNRWFTPRVVFHTHVVRGEGLREGSPVLLSGIEVGETGSLTIMNDNRIDVEIIVLEQHAHRLRAGSKAVIRRLLGIGEKRIELVSSAENSPPLPAGALLPADEPVDLLDALSSIDLGLYIRTMDRAVNAMEVMLVKLEEGNRLERMVLAFDQMGPTMEKMNNLLDEVDEPMAALFKDESLRRTFQGADRLFNDPNTRLAMRNVASTFEPERIDRMLERTDQLIGRFDALLAENGHLQGAMAGMDRLVNDGRVDRMLTSLERLSNAEKIEKLVDNMGVLAEQMAKIGPEIPHMSKELLTTLREAVVVLKALQKTWLLEDESGEVRQELEKKRETSD